jgi:hypothetical protein
MGKFNNLNNIISNKLNIKKTIKRIINKPYRLTLRFNIKYVNL